MIEYDLAEGFWARAVGLLGRRGMPPRRALFFPHCGCVHTFGMRFALDLVFVRADGTVDAVRRGVRPWRIAWGTRRSDAVYELAAGALPPDTPRPGEPLAWICVKAHLHAGIHGRVSVSPEIRTLNVERKEFS